MIVIIGIFIEFLQYLSQGPDFDYVIPFVDYFSSAVSLQLENIMSMHN